jgi:hypothetical protein
MVDECNDTSIHGLGFLVLVQRGEVAPDVGGTSWGEMQFPWLGRTSTRTAPLRQHSHCNAKPKAQGSCLCQHALHLGQCAGCVIDDSAVVVDGGLGAVGEEKGHAAQVQLKSLAITT